MNVGWQDDKLTEDTVGDLAVLIGQLGMRR